MYYIGCYVLDKFDGTLVTSDYKERIFLERSLILSHSCLKHFLLEVDLGRRRIVLDLQLRVGHSIRSNWTILDMYKVIEERKIVIAAFR